MTWEEDATGVDEICMKHLSESHGLPTPKTRVAWMHLHALSHGDLEPDPAMEAAAQYLDERLGELRVSV